MKLLWIDDLRDPKRFINIQEYESVYWADTFEEGIAAIADDYDHIHLDNDLSDPYDRQGKHIFDYVDEKLFYDELDNLKAIIIHSDNSSAVHSMMLAKDRFRENYDVTVHQMIFKSHN